MNTILFASMDPWRIIVTFPAQYFSWFREGGVRKKSTLIWDLQSNILLCRKQKCFSSSQSLILTVLMLAKKSFLVWNTVLFCSFILKMFKCSCWLLSFLSPPCSSYTDNSIETSLLFSYFRSFLMNRYFPEEAI